MQLDGRTIRIGVACAAALLLACLLSYRLGERQGFERALFWAASQDGLTNAVLAVEVLRSLDANDHDQAVRTLDLEVDSGIAAQSQYLEVHRRWPDRASRAPDEAADWLYQYLLDYRKEHPSRVADETKYIGPNVSEALATNR